MTQLSWVQSDQLLSTFQEQDVRQVDQQMDRPGVARQQIRAGSSKQVNDISSEALLT